MGLIKAALGAAGGVMADQWREYFYCEAIPSDVLAVKGRKKVTGRSSNTKGDDNIISNGSVIAISDGQCMLIVEQGKVVDVCAEPGEYTYDMSTEPSIFYGDLGENVKNVFMNIGKRFTFGGEAPKDQRIYYFNTKEIVGNKKKLTQWQDRFWEHMVKKYPDLERGESASETGRDHIPPRVFKEMTRLTKQKAKLEELLSGVNAFNAKGKAAEIGAFLDKYIPAVEQMHTTLKKYNTAFTVTTAENKKLKKKTEQLEQSLDKATQESTLKKLADAKLHRDYEDAVAVLDRIPKEVLAAYTHRTEKERETAYGR